MVAIPLELLWLEQRVGQVDEQSRRDEAGERIIEDHDDSLSKLVAGVNVCDRCREQGETNRQHDNVHHGNAPVSRIL